jgi:hypothetical protein
VSESKPIKWSHSALKKFEQCPRQYHETAVLKKHPHKDTPQTMYGKQVHEVLEHYLREGKPIPPEFSFFQPMADAIKQKPGRLLAEHEMALTADLKPCGFKDPNVWVRGIADVLIVDDDNLTAWVADWKTGNNRYPDRDQLVLMSLMVFEHFPHVRKVNSALLFVLKNDMVKMQMQRSQAQQFWWKYRERVARIEACHAAGVWNPKASPLCPWCPCTSCEHHPKH